MKWIDSKGLTLLVLATAAGCGGDSADPSPPPPPPPPPPPVVVIDVIPNSATPTVGQTVQFTATPRTATGAAVTGKTITWNSSSAVVATVSTEGLLTAVTPGQAILSATVDGVTGTAPITVLPLQAASCTNCLEVFPGASLLPAAGATQQFVAFQVNAAGVRTAVTATFESSNPAVITVTPAGLATAASALGSSQVIARAGNQPELHARSSG